MKSGIFLVFLLFTSGLVARTYRDSLRTVWNDPTQADTSRLKAISWFSLDCMDTDPDSAIYYSNLQFDFAEIRGLTAYRASALDLRAGAYAVKGDLSEAILYYQQSHDLYEEVGNKREMAGALYSIGSVYWTAGDYDIAIDYRQQSIKIAQEIGDKEQEASCLRGIAYSYFQQGQLAIAMRHVHQALLISEEIEDEYGISWCINALGVFYSRQGSYEKALEYYFRGLVMNEEKDDKSSISYSLRYIGDAYAALEKNDLALEYYEGSLAIDKELNEKRSLAFSFASIGALQNKMGQPELALDYFRQALDLSREIGNKDLECEHLELIGAVHVDMGNYKLGAMECQKSYDIALTIGAIDDQLNACKCLYKANKAMGKFVVALELHETILALDDSLNIRALADNLSQMEFQKEMLADSLKQEEAKLKVEMTHQQEVAQKEKTKNMFMAGGLLFLLASIGFFSRWRYVKKSRDTIAKEKDRSENLLLNILPAEIAEELKAKGKADARDFEMVSIVFTDFKGFTAASEKLSAHDLVSEINTCFEAFDGIIVKYKIEKIKTIGDSYMAAGGLPVPTDDSVTNTVLAALEMQAFISNRKAEMDAVGKPAFEMRVGIHTGPVVAGIVGVKKFQYDIWGDTVNTASRMESSGEVGKVNISQVTYELVKRDSAFTFESRGKIAVKGKGEMDMYFVLGSSERRQEKFVQKAQM